MKHRCDYVIIAVRRIIPVFLACAMFFTGCAQNPVAADSSNTSIYEKFLTIDVYDGNANFEGIQSGWYARLIKDKFNIELNIIAPNTSGNSDNIFETRFAAGNIGDLIICTAKGNKLQRLVDAGLVLDMERYIRDSDVYSRYQTQIEALNRQVAADGIYAIPSTISTISPDTPSEALAPTYGAYVRWDYYAELGYPTINTLEDLLPVLKQMQENHPYSDSGADTYAFSLFTDWDNNMMNAIKQPCCFYGYDEYGFVLSKADGSDFQNILDDDSLYMRVLRFYNKAYQMGLVDPDSINQDYNELSDKFSDGQILFSPWPWLAQPAYNTSENMDNGKGYMFVPINDELIYSYGCKTYGSYDSVIAIGSEAEDPFRLASFIDWLYSTEGIMASCASSYQGTAGIEGLTWQMTDSGPALTDFGIQAFYSANTQMPEEYGGGTWSDGICQLNYNPVATVERAPEGFTYYFSTWDSIISVQQSNLEKDWSEHVNAISVMDYLLDNEQLIVSPGVTYSETGDSTEITTIRMQCASVIVSYSWKMVFASDDSEFQALYDDLCTRTAALGYSQVLEYDMLNAHGEAEAKLELLNTDK